MEVDIKEIPSLPTVTLEVIKFDPAAPTASSNLLESIISPDKGLSGNIMKVANSSFYGQSGKVNTLKSAITLLGLKATKNLAILMTGGGLFGKLRSEPFQLLLHESSILAALIGMDIAKPLGHLELKDEAFLYGLLHNIGMSVIAINATEPYESLLEKYMNEGGSLIEQEQAAFSTDHIKVGCQVFEKWKMPSVASLVLQNYLVAAEDVEKATPLTRIVSLSITLARRLIALPEPEGTLEREAAIIKSFGGKVDVSKAINGEYYNNIQQHPFYIMVVNN